MLCPKDLLNQDYPEVNASSPSPKGPAVRLFNQDAMPFWWMAQLLLNHMNAKDKEFSPSSSSSPNSDSASPGNAGGIERRWEDDNDDLEEGEGKRRLGGLDMPGLFQTAKSLADPYTSTFLNA